ncbi:hypothetical protein GQ600_15313 [Phytophthora cactorum]|nr:hypothetical protein GQ600_15313 [Phytophthora cactorum]
MRFTGLLVLLVTIVAASGKSFTGAVEAPSNNVARASDIKDNETRRLRGGQEVENEERMIVPPYGAMVNLLHSTSATSTTSTHSSQILHAAKDHTPLPKWAKALIVLLSIGAVSGVAVGGIKLTQWLNKVVESK